MIAARQLRAASTFAAALQAALATPVTIGPTVRPVLFLPMRARRHDVERIADIAYGDAGVANTLDLYRGRDRVPGRPVLIHLHGGGFHSGRKNHEGLPLIYGLARRGWLCISANYRLRTMAIPVMCCARRGQLCSRGLNTYAWSFRAGGWIMTTLEMPPWFTQSWARS